jgi:catechol 2,3-dioxygenase-like lactoylglutathione lyase family enzyme
MALKRMDNVGIVVDDLTATIDFLLELGLELEGRAMVEGEWAGRVTGLGDQRVEIAMMRTPDRHSRLELSRFLTPPTVADHRNAPVNALGYLRVMFAVDDIDEMLERLRKRGAQLVGEVVQYKDAYRLCYIRGPEGLLLGLARSSAERLPQNAVRPHSTLGLLDARSAPGTPRLGEFGSYAALASSSA